MEDKRFAHIANDPKFRHIPRGEKKVKIDKRFQSMFSDKKFKVKYTVDKRGRPVNHSTSEDLRRYYELSSEGSEDDDSSDDNESSNVEDGDASSEEGNENDDNVDLNKMKRQDGNKIKSTKSKKSSSIADKTSNKINTSKLQKNSSKLKLQEDHKLQSTDNDSGKLQDGDLKTPDTSDKKVTETVKKKLKNLTVDYARGEGKLYSDESSSDDDEESEEEVSEAEGIEHAWGELDGDADKTDDITNRLAVCNMDWDRMRAVDLLVLFNSFLPSGGTIKHVKIYTSEFGKQRLAEEEIKGPIELLDNKNDVHEDESEEGSKYHMEKLRQYQLNRLKYFYAVVTCSDKNTANKIYTECDGMEYESTATKIDLRFIPNEMEFDDEPKEMADKLPEVNKYQPRFFVTAALQQAKVNLTWDETNPDRVELAEKLASGKIDEVTDHDLQAYLASSSGEESEEEVEVKVEESDGKNPIDKYKALLLEIENKEKTQEKKDVEMEISWGIDLEAKTQKLVKQKIQDGVSKTPFEQYLEKRKEKRKQKRENKKTDDNSDNDIPSDIDMNDSYFAEEFNKPEFKSMKKSKNKPPTSDTDDEEVNQREAELELLLSNDADDKKHFNLKKIQEQETSSSKNKKKNKRGTEQQDEFEIDVKDDRFSALFTSHHYNLDPTDPRFKKTKNMDKLIEEKLKRRTETLGDSVPKRAKKDNASAELNVLVKSVKRKAQAFTTTKK